MTTYSNRERMQATLAGEQLDYVPAWPMAFFSPAMARALVPARLLPIDLNTWPDHGVYGFGPHPQHELDRAIAFNAHIDRVAIGVGWGANWAFGHGGPGEFNARVVDGNAEGCVLEYETGARERYNSFPKFTHPLSRPVREMADVERLALPDADDPARWAGFATDVAYLKGRGEYTVGWVNGFFSGCHYFLRDYQDFLADLLLQPELVTRLLARLGDWNLRAARHMLDAGVDCIALCDDLGSSQNLLISPRLYRQHFLPWHAMLAELTHGYGAALHLHSHGNINRILDDLAGTGIDLLNPLDPTEGMDLEYVRDRYPRLTLVGGMDKYIFDQDLQTIEHRLRASVAACAGRGRFILMDTGGIPETVDRQRFDAFRHISRRVRGQEQ